MQGVIFRNFPNETIILSLYFHSKKCYYIYRDIEFLWRNPYMDSEMRNLYEIQN